MSKFLLINDGDYKVKVRQAGTITLDTSPDPTAAAAHEEGYDPTNQGQVIITGNLIVQGETTTVQTTQTTIEDRLITLNSGQTGDGITNLVNPADRTSGIEIDRGPVAPWAKILFNESLTWLDSQINDRDSIDYNQGAYSLQLSNGTLVGLRTNAIFTNSDDLNLLGVGTNIVSVKGTTNYEQQVFNYVGGVIDATKPIHDDIIPNARAMRDMVPLYLFNNPSYKIEDSYINPLDEDDTTIYNSKLVINDSQRPNVPGGPNTEARLPVSASNLELILDGNPGALWTEDYHRVQRFKIYDNVIELTGDIVNNYSLDNNNLDLILRSPGTGSVQVDDNLKLIKLTLDPAAPLDSVKLYAKTESTGGTGLYFVNNTDIRVMDEYYENLTPSQTSPLRNNELISKHKAFVYSMIF